MHPKDSPVGLPCYQEMTGEQYLHFQIYCYNTSDYISIMISNYGGPSQFMLIDV